MRRARLLLCLPLALAACQRSAPDAGAANAAAPRESAADLLMPRGVTAQARTDLTGPNRIRCKQPVPSIPCYP